MCMCHCHNTIKLRCIHKCENSMGNSKHFSIVLLSPFVSSDTWKNNAMLSSLHRLQKILRKVNVWAACKYNIVALWPLLKCRKNNVQNKC